MNPNFKKFFVISHMMSLLAIVSCGESIGEQGANSSSFQPSQVPASYDIQATTVDGQSCFDLSKALSQLKTLPSDTIVRKITTSFAVAGKTESDTTPRENFVKRLSLGSFRFLEQPIQDMAIEFPEVTQADCTDLSFVYEDGQADTFTIKEATGTSIKISKGAGQEVTFALETGRELRVSSSHLVMDFCPDYKKAKTTVLTTYRWTPGHQPHATTEAVDPKFLLAISGAIFNPPAELSNFASSSANEPVQVPVATLMTIAKAEQRRELDSCPRTNKAPIGNEPIPSPDAQPTPLPPGATPEPTPEPEVED